MAKYKKVPKPSLSDYNYCLGKMYRLLKDYPTMAPAIYKTNAIYRRARFAERLVKLYTGHSAKEFREMELQK